MAAYPPSPPTDYLALAQVIDLLACPVCASSLSLEDRVVRCPVGHSFDIARQGYVNLLGHRAPANADTAAMLDARQRFLASGIYDPLADAVAAACSNTQCIAEVGAGTGYYLQTLLQGEPGRIGVGLDVSPVACRRMAHCGLASVVADTWAGLPLRDGCVDAVVCVFAPRNAAEFARVLTDRGRVVVVTPNPGHLMALRAEYGLLGIATDKTEQMRGQFAAVGLHKIADQRLAYLTEATRNQVRDLVAMGPNAFHQPLVPLSGAVIGVDVQVSSFAPNTSATNTASAAIDV